MEVRLISENNNQRHLPQNIFLSLLSQQFNNKQIKEMEEEVYFRTKNLFMLHLIKKAIALILIRVMMKYYQANYQKNKEICHHKIEKGN